MTGTKQEAAEFNGRRGTAIQPFQVQPGSLTDGRVPRLRMVAGPSEGLRQVKGSVAMPSTSERRHRIPLILLAHFGHSSLKTQHSKYSLAII